MKKSKNKSSKKETESCGKISMKKVRNKKINLDVEAYDINVTEVFVDSIPVGFIVLNDDGLIERAELYLDDVMGNRHDAELVYCFLNKILDYEWAEDDSDLDCEYEFDIVDDKGEVL